MSIRNYNAWIKAARKAAAKTGGLSLPAARKAYTKMAVRLDRPLKGVDVKKHPRIFKQSIPVKSGGTPKKPVTPSRKSEVSKATPVRITPVRTIRSLKDFGQMLDDRVRQGLGLPNASETIEYVSTAEYRKKGKR